MSDTAVEFTVPAVAAAVAATIPDRELIIQGDRRYTYADIVGRSNRLAAYLHSRGLGCHTERSALDGHEVGQDLLGLYAYNGNEFVEALLGAFAARVAPFNVNFRYVKSELQYLLADSGATALIYHACFAPRVAEVLPDLPQLRVLIQIADDSGNALLDGAVDYETIINSDSVDARRSALARRFVRPLHRRHDRDAERRAVASARHLHDVVRRAKSDDRRAHQLARRDRGEAGRGHRHQADDSAAADSRRGAVECDDGDHDRPNRRLPFGCRPFGRRRCGPHHRAGEGDDRDGGRRRRWRGPWSPPSRRASRMCRRWPWWPTAGRC